MVPASRRRRDTSLAAAAAGGSGVVFWVVASPGQLTWANSSASILVGALIGALTFAGRRKSVKSDRSIFILGGLGMLAGPALMIELADWIPWTTGVVAAAATFWAGLLATGWVALRRFDSTVRAAAITLAAAYLTLGGIFDAVAKLQTPYRMGIAAARDCPGGLQPYANVPVEIRTDSFTIHTRTDNEGVVRYDVPRYGKKPDSNVTADPERDIEFGLVGTNDRSTDYWFLLSSIVTLGVARPEGPAPIPIDVAVMDVPCSATQLPSVPPG